MRSFPITILVIAAGVLTAIAAMIVVAEHQSTDRTQLVLAQARGEVLATGLAQELATDSAGLPTLAAAHPGSELYLIGPDGHIRTASLPEEQIVRPLIDPAPIARYLRRDAVYPLFGDDPKSLHGRTIFAAARVGDDSLYVVLRSPRTAFLPLSVGGRTLGMLALLAGGAGLIAWVCLDGRRRLRHLAGEMETVAARGEHPFTPASGDEIDRIVAAQAGISGHIRHQAEQLRQAEAMRLDLVSNVAHDLRTPLASLRGYIETLLLRDSRLGAEERLAYLQIAFRQTEHLQVLITELFDLVKLEGGETCLNPEPFQVAELIQDVVQKFGAAARKNGVSLDGKLPQRIPFAYGDVGLLERVFENVLDNAIRYTPSGGQVSLSVSAAAGTVAVEITDTGRGIPPGDIPHIFERFYRVDKSRNLTTGGAGLGLTIAKQIIDMHSGRIAVSSRLGSGTSFIITLPVAAAFDPRGVSA